MLSPGAVMSGCIGGTGGISTSSRTNS
jgi:hypothetical protein